jgi:hypothetical protein
VIYRPRSESTSICASRRKTNQLKSRERHCTTACNAPSGKFAMKLHARSGRPPFNTTKSSKKMAGKVPVADEDLCGTRSEHRRRGIASLPLIWWPDLSKDTCAACFSTTPETQCNLDGFAAAGAPSAKMVQRVLRSMQLRPPAAQVLHLHWGSATTEPLEVWRRRVIEMVIIATLRRDIARTLVPLGNVVESNPDRTVELQECWVASLDFHSPSCERWTHTRKHGQM